MTKTFVLDASVLLHDPACIFKFDDNRVIISEASIEQLNNCKRAKTELGNSAREMLSILDELRSRHGSLVDGIALNRGFFKIELNHDNIELDLKIGSDRQLARVLKVCKHLGMESEAPVCLVSKDVFTRVMADTLNIHAEDYKHDQVPVEQYTGRLAVVASSRIVSNFRQNGSLDPDQVLPSGQKLYKQQFIEIKEYASGPVVEYGRFDGQRIVALRYRDRSMFDAVPRTVGQEFYRECLLAPPSEAPLVIARGPAGTAKTFLALAGGLEQTYTDDPIYRKILFCRPNIFMDEEIGYLPGTEEEKIAPLARGIIDNLEILLDTKDATAPAKTTTQKQRLRAERDLKAKVKSLFDDGYINTEAIAYIRGRSITRNFIIIDEAQNLTPNQTKGILSRAAADTKIILCGDPDQIDHPFLDYRTNGLSYASEKLKGNPICWQVAFSDEECERSPLANAIARLL